MERRPLVVVSGRIQELPVGDTIPGGGGSSTEENSFEKLNKNLKSYNYSINYSNGILTSIQYTTPNGSITKTLNYTNGLLTSIVFSGAIPTGISTTKTFTYTNGVITSIVYT